MRIREAAKELKIGISTLRRLESEGVLKAPVRDLNGHRRYSQKDVEEMRRVLYAREVAPPGATASPSSDKISALVERFRRGKEAAAARRADGAG